MYTSLWKSKTNSPDERIRRGKGWIILSVLFVMLLMIGLEIASAEQTFVGEVVSIHRRPFGRVITVKGDKEEVLLFAVGRKTVYIPPRLPAVGEQVKVEYVLQRGHNAATKMEVISPH